MSVVPIQIHVFKHVILLAFNMLHIFFTSIYFIYVKALSLELFKKIYRYE